MSTPDGRKVLDIHGRYFEASSRGNLFVAYAIVTTPAIWSTEAGTGGPLLWNGSAAVPGRRVNANILAVGFGFSVVSTAAVALGFTGGYGQTAAPTTTTAIDSVSNLLCNDATARCTAYRIGTTGTNRFFMPIAHAHTGALTVSSVGVQWIDVEGMITVPPDSFVSLAASATGSTLVMHASMVWEEVPA